jgi:hypothetical protein
VCFYFVLRKIVPKMILQKIKDLVGENRLRKALTALENALPQSLQHQVVELKRQLTALESDSRIGLLTYSEEGTRRTKISLGILSLADEINSKTEIQKPKIEEKMVHITINNAGAKIGQQNIDSKVENTSTNFNL